MCTVGSTRGLNRRQTQTWNSKTALWFDTSLENVGSRGIKFLFSMVAVLPETIWKQCQKNKTFQQSGIILSRWDDIIVKISNSIWLHMKRVTRQIYLYLCVENLSILGNLVWCFLVLVDWQMIISLSFCRSKLIDWWLFPAAEAGSGAGPAADGAWTDRFLLNVLIVGYNGFWIFCLFCNLWCKIWQI